MPRQARRRPDPTRQPRAYALRVQALQRWAGPIVALAAAVGFVL